MTTLTHAQWSWLMTNVMEKMKNGQSTPALIACAQSLGVFKRV